MCPHLHGLNPFFEWKDPTLTRDRSDTGPEQKRRCTPGIEPWIVHRPSLSTIFGKNDTHRSDPEVRRDRKSNRRSRGNTDVVFGTTVLTFTLGPYDLLAPRLLSLFSGVRVRNRKDSNSLFGFSSMDLPRPKPLTPRPSTTFGTFPYTRTPPRPRPPGTSPVPGNQPLTPLRCLNP